MVADAHIAPHYHTDIDSAAAALPDDQTAMCAVPLRNRRAQRPRYLVIAPC